MKSALYITTGILNLLIGSLVLVLVLFDSFVWRVIIDPSFIWLTLLFPILIIVIGIMDLNLVNKSKKSSGCLLSSAICQLVSIAIIPVSLLLGLIFSIMDGTGFPMLAMAVIGGIASSLVFISGIILFIIGIILRKKIN